jgi:hypothetical protein
MRRIARSKTLSRQSSVTVRFYASPVRPSPAFPCHRGDFPDGRMNIDRLRTIISYDRICVMDNGNIAEFDAPDVLHAQNGIFRAMCEHSSITLEDIRRARKERAVRDELEIG